MRIPKVVLLQMGATLGSGRVVDQLRELFLPVPVMSVSVLRCGEHPRDSFAAVGMNWSWACSWPTQGAYSYLFLLLSCLCSGVVRSPEVVLLQVGATWGSGVIVDQHRKVILTCSHVVKEAHLHPGMWHERGSWCHLLHSWVKRWLDSVDWIPTIYPFIRTAQNKIVCNNFALNQCFHLNYVSVWPFGYYCVSQQFLLWTGLALCISAVTFFSELD